MRCHRHRHGDDGAPDRRLGLRAMAMAVVMAGSGPLPALAGGRAIGLAAPGMPGTVAATLSPLSDNATQSLVAREPEDHDEKKKKKKKKEQEASSPQSINKEKPAKKQETKNLLPSRQNGTQQPNQRVNQTPANPVHKTPQINDKQRERIYQQGFQEGRTKGLEKGFDRGYDKGWVDRRARDRERWKDWDSRRWREYNNSRRNRDLWTRRVVINNYGTYPDWARQPGWYNSRPWGGNWYGGWNSPPWGWWGGQSMVWGLTALTAAAIINSAINRAISQQQSAIVVPSTTWQLYYGTVQPVENYGVTFAVNNGYGTFQMGADCEQGLLDGDVPSTPAEAQLVNAACQVTYGREV